MLTLRSGLPTVPEGWFLGGAFLLVALMMIACGDPTGTGGDPPSDDEPPQSSEVVAVSAGEAHSCAVDALGRVSCWGRNDVGQLGIGTWGPAPATIPRQVSQGSEEFASVELGKLHTCALTTDREILCWGS